MIYDKNASFPYPVLSNEGNYFEDSYFHFDTSLQETKTEYIFTFEYEIGSDFIQSLYRENKLVLLFIINSEDNYFEKIKYGGKTITIPKNRLSLTRNTKIQLQLQSTEEIPFFNCMELTPFYDGLKNQIIVPKYSLLGYSEIETYLGSSNESIILFESRIDPEMQSAFAVDLGSSTIVLKFKNKEYALNGLTRSNSIPNMYIYFGLSKALSQFIHENLSDSSDDEYVDIESISREQEFELNQKLLDLMINKGVDSLGLDNIDQVIDQISDQIIEKFVSDIKEVAMNEG